MNLSSTSASSRDGCLLRRLQRFQPAEGILETYGDNVHLDGRQTLAYARIPQAGWRRLRPLRASAQVLVALMEKLGDRARLICSRWPTHAVSADRALTVADSRGGRTTVAATTSATWTPSACRRAPTFRTRSLSSPCSPRLRLGIAPQLYNRLRIEPFHGDAGQALCAAF